MGDLVITLEGAIDNISLQLGDKAYSVSVQANAAGGQDISSNHETQTPKEIGIIKAISSNTITISESSLIHTPSADDFLMFSKDKAANNTSLIGYYAEVKLANNSNKKAELFALSSEIVESCK